MTNEMTPLETFKALLCDPSGRVAIHGSEMDIILLQKAIHGLETLRETHIMIARDDVPDDLSHILEDGRGYDQFDRIQIFMDLSALIQKEMDK